MHMVTAGSVQAGSADRVERGSGGPVVEPLRRGLRGQSQIDRDGMPLVCSDAFDPVPTALDGEALLVIAGNDGIEFRPA
jgi:hypothetical protein